MSSEHDEVREAVAAVLVHHHLRVKTHDGCFCDCGDWSVGRGPGAIERHAAHVAAAIVDECLGGVAGK